MTAYRYPPLPSVHTTVNGDNAFDDDTAGPDSLIVGKGASLIADDAYGAILGALGGAWNVSINGEIKGGNVYYGIHLKATIADTSTITIGHTGKVSGYDGIFAESPVTIKTAGFISNTGPSEVAILLGNFGTNVLVNTGRIEAIFHAIEAFNAIDKITNTKTIIGDIQLNGGNDTLTNSGKIFGNIGLGIGADTFTNFRKVGHHVVSGNILPNGVFNGIIDLGAGDDKFKGGSHTERVMDGDGHDIVTLSGGNDRYIATGGSSNFDLADVINGGKGIDYYDASATDNAVRINLDKIQHDGGTFGATLLAAHFADGEDVAGNFTDTITDFENARSGDNSDLIYGSGAANSLSGAGGLFDEIFGFGGNDKLNGEAGFDLLVGGRGKDILTGGTESDIFGYSSTKDSGTTKATRDVITDFEDGTNRIDLARIDANTKLANDQAFNFIGTDVHFTGHRGELLAHSIANGFLIEGDVNGDKKADFTIEVVDPDHSIVWSGVTGETFEL
jgi:hypothetical protein